MSAAGELVLQRLFDAAAERHPDRPAVGDGASAWTYAELDERARAVAAWLAARGVGRGALVALFVERSPDYAAAMWGVLKAGAACLPLDPADPWPRLAATLRLARPAAAVGRAAQVPGVAAEAGIEMLDLRWDAPDLAGRGETVAGEPDDLAFVFYTSGSTGEPKGVMLSQATCSAFIPWVRSTFDVGPEDRHLFRTTVSFVSVLRQLVWPNVTGGYAAVLPAGRERDLRAVADLVRDERISIMGFIPSGFARMLTHVDRSEMGAVRHVLCGGEPLSKALQLTAFEKLGAEIHNLYALSEAPLVMHWRCTPDDERAVAPMGDPIPGVEIALADPDTGEPAGDEGAAELYVGGVAAASGYLNAPELTAERFGPGPGGEGGGWLRTRDLVRRVGGALEYAGRADSLVKIRGFRIEPGEVEAALNAFRGVRQSLVTKWEPQPGDRRLVAYLAYEGDRAPEAAALREFLRERVPAYMVPSLFIGVGAFPVGPNGKVDRAALPDPAGAARDGGPMFVAPRDELEREIAEVWQTVLRVESVGVYDEFVDIGGESLLALQILTELEQAHGVEVPLEEFAEASTVAELAAVLRAVKERAGEPA